MKSGGIAKVNHTVMTAPHIHTPMVLNTGTAMVNNIYLTFDFCIRWRVMYVHMRAYIVKQLARYYIGYHETKWKKFLQSDDDQCIEADFNRAWGREHGGFISKALIANISNVYPDEGPPIFKQGRLVLPGFVTGDKAKYIRAGNKILLDNPGCKLDLRDCSGGWPQVMFAALLPIFNNYTGTLTWCKRAHSYVRDMVCERGKITSIVNGNSTCRGTKRAINITKLTVLIGPGTASSAEQIIIALLGCVDDLVVLGAPTAGLTTSIKYIPLGDLGGMEVPYGYMTDRHKRRYTVVKPS